MATTLGQRLAQLEASWSGDDAGCDRCLGTMLILSDAISGAFCGAERNGEAITEDELQERETETECPNCGRKFHPDELVEIVIGGI
jgi:hypothetical protein